MFGGVFITVHAFDVDVVFVFEGGEFAQFRRIELDGIPFPVKRVELAGRALDAVALALVEVRAGAVVP